MTIKILKWKCDVCGKVIESIYPTQFESNKHFHRLTHTKKKGDKIEQKGRTKD